MKRTWIFSIAAALAVTGGALSGQATVPTIPFDSNPSPLMLPDNVHLGEVAGVATNSRGDIYVYTRTGNPTITRRSLYFLYNASRSSYCGVKPHLLAVFTINIFFPFNIKKISRCYREFKNKILN